ncbi:unnamed protein product [Amoebophrya sp. A25]|nr:unnamed protein product [Amoebophrya sp. A25]|eukprot:GSA25T00025809001.1
MHLQLEGFAAARKTVNQARALLQCCNTYRGSELSGYVAEVAADVCLAMAAKLQLVTRAQSSQRTSFLTSTAPPPFSRTESAPGTPGTPAETWEDAVTSTSDSGSGDEVRTIFRTTATITRGNEKANPSRPSRSSRQKFRRHIDASLKTTFIPFDQVQQETSNNSRRSRRRKPGAGVAVTPGELVQLQTEASDHLVNALENYEHEALEDVLSLNRASRKLAFLHNDTREFMKRDKATGVVRGVARFLGVQAEERRTVSKKDITAPLGSTTKKTKAALSELKQAVQSLHLAANKKMKSSTSEAAPERGESVLYAAASDGPSASVDVRDFAINSKSAVVDNMDVD